MITSVTRICNRTSASNLQSKTVSTYINSGRKNLLLCACSGNSQLFYPCTTLTDKGTLCDYLAMTLYFLSWQLNNIFHLANQIISNRLHFGKLFPFFLSQNLSHAPKYSLYHLLTRMRLSASARECLTILINYLFFSILFKLAFYLTYCSNF